MCNRLNVGNYLRPVRHSVQMFAEVHFLQFSLHFLHMVDSAGEQSQQGLKFNNSSSANQHVP